MMNVTNKKYIAITDAGSREMITFFEIHQVFIDAYMIIRAKLTVGCIDKRANPTRTSSNTRKFVLGQAQLSSPHAPEKTCYQLRTTQIFIIYVT